MRMYATMHDQGSVQNFKIPPSWSRLALFIARNLRLMYLKRLI